MRFSRRSFLLSAPLLLALSASFIGAGGSVTPLTKSWEKAIPEQRVPDGLVSLNAGDCGACHAEQYAEWKRSTHAHALSDRQFQAEWKKDNVYVCRNCHTPLQNQLPTIVTGLIDGDYRHPVETRNPRFDNTLQAEALTCAVCHVRNGMVIGPTGAAGAPHAVVRDTAFLSATLCMSCHNAVDTLNPMLVCTFETGDEWKNNWAHAEGKTCITCHMPDTITTDFQDHVQRRRHIHSFPGSGIAKEIGDTVSGLNGLEIIADSIRGEFAPKEELRYSISVRNRYAGHNVPTGDPERYFMIALRVNDAAGATIASKQYRIGEEWVWYPAARKVSDNNLAPREVRAYSLVTRLPNTSRLMLTIEVTKHRMSKENARFDHLENVYPLSITVFSRSFPICIKGNVNGKW